MIALPKAASGLPNNILFRRPSLTYVKGMKLATIWTISGMVSRGKKVPEICRLLEISEQTYYRWRQKYGGMKPEMAKELKSLQKENDRLKRLVADQALDISILKEASRGN